MSMLKCPNCGQVYNDGNTYYCLRCNVKLQPINQVAETKNPQLTDISSRVVDTITPSSPTITCPTCGSTNTRKMGSIERCASILTFGIFSKKINKSFKCNSCGYTW